MTAEHVESVLDYHIKNKQHLAPWEPTRSDDYFTKQYWVNMAKNSEAAFKQGTEYKFIAFTNEPKPKMIGICTFSAVVRGPFQACFLGYSIAKDYENKGYMTEILQATMSYIFTVVGLNRVMANYMPNNERSARVLTKLGFEQEGYAKRYLKIAGIWQDHVLCSKIAPLKTGAD